MYPRHYTHYAKIQKHSTGSHQEGIPMSVHDLTGPSSTNTQNMLITDALDQNATREADRRSAGQ